MNEIIGRGRKREMCVGGRDTQCRVRSKVAEFDPQTSPYSTHQWHLQHREGRGGGDGWRDGERRVEREGGREKGRGRGMEKDGEGWRERRGGGERI